MRKKVKNRKKDNKIFKRTASRIKRANVITMRGGHRL